MDASIIICTYNRAAKLNETLLSLASMRTDSDTIYEVIIVDNKSNDGTKQVVMAWAGRLPIRYLYEPRTGLSHARNRGIEAARGRFILFTDDDCIVSSDWLLNGIQLISDEPLQIVGGRVDLYDVTDLPLTIKVADQPAALESAGNLLGFLHGCNMIFGRCVVSTVGPFDTLLGAGTLCRAAEDTDFVYRALKHGIPVRYRPELRLAHNHGRKHAREEEKLTEGYNLSVGALAFKHCLNGDVELLKVAYWALRAEVRSKQHIRLWNYLRGLTGYGYSLAQNALRAKTAR